MKDTFPAIARAVAFERRLRKGDAVRARWTHGLERYEVKAKVVAVLRQIVRVKLLEPVMGLSYDMMLGCAMPAERFAVGHVVEIPRALRPRWSHTFCVIALENP